MNTTDSFVPREPRYQVSSKDLEVTVERAVDGTLERVRGQIVDISRSGAKIRTEAAIQVNGAFGLELKSEALMGSLSVSSEVCWMEPSPRGDYTLGCTFTPPVPEEVLEALTTGGALERRLHERIYSDIVATARWELQGEVNEVTIVNFSEGGLCYNAKEKGKPGDRVLMTFESKEEGGRPISILCKGHWQVECEDGYTVGCEFSDMTGFQALRDRAGPAETDEDPGSMWRRLLGRG